MSCITVFDCNSESHPAPIYYPSSFSLSISRGPARRYELGQHHVNDRPNELSSNVVEFTFDPEQVCSAPYDAPDGRINLLSKAAQIVQISSPAVGMSTNCNRRFPAVHQVEHTMLLISVVALQAKWRQYAARKRYLRHVDML